jgi:hypothetical protein
MEKGSKRQVKSSFDFCVGQKFGGEISSKLDLKAGQKVQVIVIPPYTVYRKPYTIIYFSLHPAFFVTAGMLESQEAGKLKILIGHRFAQMLTDQKIKIK